MSRPQNPARPSPGPFAYESPTVETMLRCVASVTSNDVAVQASHSLVTALASENSREDDMAPESFPSVEDETNFRLNSLGELLVDLAGCAMSEAGEFRDASDHRAAWLKTLRALGELIALTAAHAETLAATVDTKHEETKT